MKGARKPGAPLLAPPTHGRGGGGCAAHGGTGDHPVPDPGPLRDIPHTEQQPLSAREPVAQPALQHAAVPHSAVQHPHCPCSRREGPGSCLAGSRRAAPCCSQSPGGGSSPCVPSACAAAVSVAENVRRNNATRGSSAARGADGQRRPSQHTSGNDRAHILGRALPCLRP